MSSSMGHPVQNRVNAALESKFAPDHLEVINESGNHNVPQGSETHFKVVIVSTSFQDQSLVQRHRIVNQSLATELSGPIHALSIVALTPQEWQSRKQSIPQSPPCLGNKSKN